MTATTRMKPVLEIDAARTVGARTVAAAVEQGLKVAVAIVDDGGHLLYFERMNGVAWGSGDVALAKAVSAAAYSRDTQVFDQRLTGGRLAVLGQPHAFPIEGGIALHIDGQCVGAVGASGALAPQDTALCQAGAMALLPAGADHA